MEVCAMAGKYWLQDPAYALKTNTLLVTKEEKLP